MACYSKSMTPAEAIEVHNRPLVIEHFFVPGMMTVAGIAMAAVVRGVARNIFFWGGANPKNIYVRMYRVPGS